MKKPIISEQHRRFNPFIMIEIAKLQFKREFERTDLYLFLELSIIMLSKLLDKIKK